MLSAKLNGGAVGHVQRLILLLSSNDRVALVTVQAAGLLKPAGGEEVAMWTNLARARRPRQPVAQRSGSAQHFVALVMWKAWPSAWRVAE